MTGVQTCALPISTSIQQLSTTDPRRDSLTLDVQYRIGLNRDSEVVTAGGIIEDFMVTTGNRLGLVTTLVDLPISFIGSITTHELQFESNNSKDQRFSSVRCEIPSQAALATIQRNLFVSPLKIEVGMLWTDSLSYTICNGEVPIQLISVRTYIVTGALFYKGDQVIVVERTEKTLSTGEGSQGQHRISIRGNGTGTARIYIDRSNGLLLALNGENKTDLLIQSSGRVQKFLQTSRETIVRR